MVLFLADTSHPLHKQMLRSYNAAFTEGTHRNRERQAAVYIKFCLTNHFPYLSPTISQACLFIQHLANTMLSPATCRNYVSGVKSWISARGGNPSAFMSPEASAVLKGAARLSNHVPDQAPPLSPDQIKCICDYLDRAGPQGLGLKAATLIAYFTFLRSSNVLSPLVTTWGGPHTLRRRDIIPRPHGLTVVIRSSKTITTPTQAVALMVHHIPGSPYCPVAAWKRYCNWVPAPLEAPAFLLDGNRPMTAGPLIATIRSALTHAGFPNVQHISMHSFRRGGAQTAAGAGAKPQELCQHGTWLASSSLATYVPREMINSVPTRLASAFAPSKATEIHHH